MISKADILQRAREWQLTPEVVEKDYVLGWLLAGIAWHPATTNNWVFKGGTCLKKCVLETYRFSEDLDFTLLPVAEYSEAGIEAILHEIVAQVTSLSGIQFPATGLRVKACDELPLPVGSSRCPSSFRNALCASRAFWMSCSISNSA